ncbi:hypothetical protein L7F22_028603 [Adiantum nelumboides]|nr:hypothetical protein [Adiantum nelumboides]
MSEELSRLQVEEHVFLRTLKIYDDKHEGPSDEITGDEVRVLSSRFGLLLDIESRSDEPRLLCYTAEVRRLQETRSEFSHHASVSYWILRADRMNQDFFATHRERPTGSTMRAIRDNGDILHIDLDQVLAIASNFYEDLFSTDSVTLDILEARKQIWSMSRVTDDMCYQLMEPFIVDELRDAIHSLAPSFCLRG